MESKTKEKEKEKHWSKIVTIVSLVLAIIGIFWPIYKQQEQSEKKASNLINTAERYYLNNNYDKALEVNKEAFNLVANDKGSRIYYVALYNQANCYAGLGITSGIDQTSNLKNAVATYQYIIQDNYEKEPYISFAAITNLTTSLGALYEITNDTKYVNQAEFIIKKTLSDPMYQRHMRNETPFKLICFMASAADVLCILSDSKDTKANLTQAIELYSYALKYGYQENYPDTMIILNNLGLAFDKLAELEEPKLNIEKAIEAYRTGLEIYNLSKPTEYSLLNYNLGGAFLNLYMVEGKEELIDKSIRVLKQAEKYSKTAELKGLANNSLGLAYLYKAKHVEPVSNLKNAIGYLEQAKDIFDPNEYLPDHRMTLKNLGIVNRDLYQKTRNDNYLRDAISYFEEAGIDKRNLFKEQASMPKGIDQIMVSKKLSTELKY